MNIIAIHAAHDGAVSIAKDNKLIVHAQIDRFNNLVASAMPCSKIFKRIKKLNLIFDVVLFSSLAGSCYNWWEDGLKSYDLISKKTKILYFDNWHHHFHMYCAMCTVGNNKNIVVIDGGGIKMPNGSFENETLFQNEEIVKQTFKEIGLSYEYKTADLFNLKPHNSFRACGKTMALSCFRDDIRYFQEQTEKKIKEFMPTEDVTYTGGVAQNVLANSQFLNYKNFKIDPLCTDQGISLGVLNKYLNLKLKVPHPVYLGFEPEYDLSIFKGYKIKKVTIKEVCKILKNNPIGYFQGRSEQGQRGLGNRSLLMDATNPKAVELVNNIKKREWFRPFSPAILEEEASKYFHIKKPSPYMLYVFKNKIRIPATMSIDGTSRVQTVSKKDNPNFYKLLKNFHVPFVLNTSLNLSGHTLVEDLEDLKYMMDYGNLKYSYLPEKEILIIR